MKPVTAEEMKRIQLDIMDAIHHFCVEHHITYSLSYGTLLGAVRHGGYIPWDDDIDIVMPRPDYERFLKEFNAAGEENLAISEPRTDERQIYPFAKVYDKRTIWYQEGYAVDTGIYVDIFPYDDLADTLEESLAFAKQYHRVYLFMAAKLSTFRMMKSFVKKVGLAVFKLRYLMTRPSDVIIPAIQTLVDRKKPDSLYVGYVFGRTPKYSVMRRSMLSHIAPIKFEDREYLAIEERDEYLTTMYGDWKQLPPVEMRKGHSQKGIYWLD